MQKECANVVNFVQKLIFEKLKTSVLLFMAPLLLLYSCSAVMVPEPLPNAVKNLDELNIAGIYYAPATILEIKSSGEETAQIISIRHSEEKHHGKIRLIPVEGGFLVEYRGVDEFGKISPEAFLSLCDLTDLHLDTFKLRHSHEAYAKANAGTDNSLLKINDSIEFKGSPENNYEFLFKNAKNIFSNKDGLIFKKMDGVPGMDSWGDIKFIRLKIKANRLLYTTPFVSFSMMLGALESDNDVRSRRGEKWIRKNYKILQKGPELNDSHYKFACFGKRDWELEKQAIEKRLKGDVNDAVFAYRLLAINGYHDSLEQLKYLENLGENQDDIRDLNRDLIGYQLFKQRKYDTAIGFWKEESLKGSGLANHNLGVLYKKGIGLEKNLKLAGKYFAKAEKLGFIEDKNLVLKKKSKKAPKRAKANVQSQHTIKEIKEKVSHYRFSNNLKERDSLEAILWAKRLTAPEEKRNLLEKIQDFPMIKGVGRMELTSDAVFSGRFDALVKDRYLNGTLQYEKDGKVRQLGEYIESSLNGYGRKNLFANGRIDTKYKGNFKKGRLDGNGILIDENGIHSGEFSKGKEINTVLNDDNTWYIQFADGKSLKKEIYEKSFYDDRETATKLFEGLFAVSAKEQGVNYTTSAERKKQEIEGWNRAVRAAKEQYRTNRNQVSREGDIFDKKFEKIMKNIRENDLTVARTIDEEWAYLRFIARYGRADIAKSLHEKLVESILSSNDINRHDDYLKYLPDSKFSLKVTDSLITQIYHQIVRPLEDINVIQEFVINFPNAPGKLIAQAFEDSKNLVKLIVPSSYSTLEEADRAANTLFADALMSKEQNKKFIFAVYRNVLINNIGFRSTRARLDMLRDSDLKAFLSEEFVNLVDVQRESTQELKNELIGIRNEATNIINAVTNMDSQIASIADAYNQPVDEREVWQQNQNFLYQSYYFDKMNPRE